MEWKVDPLYLCKFSESAMEALRSFKPNIMDTFCCSEFDKFISIWSNMILSLTIKRSFLNHVARALIQAFPALMLQQSSTVRALNIDALSKRLKLWEEGRFNEILDEAMSIQKELKHAKFKPSSSKKKNLEKLRFY